MRKLFFLGLLSLSLLMVPDLSDGPLGAFAGEIVDKQRHTNIGVTANIDEDTTTQILTRMATGTGRKHAWWSRKGKSKTIDDKALRDPNEIQVRLLMQADATWAVPTLLNDQIVGIFQVQMEAEHTVISPRTAKKLGLRITPQTPQLSIKTSKGMVAYPVVTLKNISIGKVQVRDVKAVVRPLKDDVTLCGMLGKNFFKDLNTTLHRGNLIISARPGEPAAQ